MPSGKPLPTLVLALALSACRVNRAYECATDTDCAGAGASARCEATRFCSAVDTACASGRRYDEYAGAGLGGACVGGTDGGVSDAPQAPGCPAGYVIVGSLSGGYRYSTTNASWSAAEADCENDAPSTHLAVIDSANENDTLESRLVGEARIWFGLSDRVTEGTYRTVTNVVQTYLPWDQDEPMGQDDCVAVKETDFADEDCAEAHPYVCECDGVAAVPSSY